MTNEQIGLLSFGFTLGCFAWAVFAKRHFVKRLQESREMMECTIKICNDHKGRQHIPRRN